MPPVFFANLFGNYLLHEIKKTKGDDIMREFKASIVRNRYGDMLSSLELKRIDTSIAQSPQTITDSNFKEFVKLVGKKGYPFCPATFRERIKSTKTFEQSQVLALYFDITDNMDSNISYDEICDRAKRYELPILFAYDSYSQIFAGSDNVKCTKFCLVFLLDISFTEVKEAEAVQKALMMIFPEADKSCSVLKTYQGGNKVLYFNNIMPTLDVEWLFMKMCLCLRERHGTTNYKRKINEFTSETEVALNDKKLPDVSIVDAGNDLEENDDNIMPKCIIDKGSGRILSHLKYKINFKDENVTVQNICQNKEIGLERK